MSAGIAALSGPDHATGDPRVPYLLASHQTFASLTVMLAVALFAVRFLATRGIRGGWALLYLVCTLALLVFVSVTGYFGGEMAYHHAVGVTVNNLPVAVTSPGEPYVRALLPAKPITALLGFLCIVELAGWLAFGRMLAPNYFAGWWRALRQEYANANAPLWTLQRGYAAERQAVPPAARAYDAPRQAPPRPGIKY